MGLIFKNKILSIFVLLLLMSAPMLSQNISEEARKLKVQMEQKAERYLVKDSSILDYFLIHEEGISTFSSPEMKALDSAEFVLYWNEIETFKQIYYGLNADSTLQLYLDKAAHRYPEKLSKILPAPKREWKPEKNNLLPLEGMRVALDAGHVGGTMEMAIMEQKFVRIRKGDHPDFPAAIEFNEGNLAVATAFMIKKRLEASGAEVLLTREGIGLTVFGGSFEEWEKKRFRIALSEYAKEKELTKTQVEWWLQEASDKDIFHRIFKHDDFKERAKKINAFQPDLTVIIHYNVEEMNEADPDYYHKPQKNNYCMAFVPGSFMKGELDSPEDRMEFVAKLVSDDIETSSKFCDYAIKRFVQILGVPIVPEENNLKYLNNASLLTEYPGVYARNLSLTRMINGTICFGESLLQDNEKECIHLFSIDKEIEGIRTSARLEFAAEAYFQAILDYAAHPYLMDKN